MRAKTTTHTATGTAAAGSGGGLLRGDQLLEPAGMRLRAMGLQPCVPRLQPYVPQACDSEPWGSFPLRSLDQCVRACLGCARCSYLSFSRANQDCSWFYTCDLERLHTRFAAQAGYQTFDLTAGFEAFGKYPVRKDPYAEVSWRSAVAPPTDDRWPALPPTLSDTVEVSILMQYWAARPRTVDFAANAKQFIEQLTFCALASGLSFEVLVNSDSRHARNGDAATLVRALGPSGFLVLSPNLGETRAYNMLARLARGHLLLLVQDDWRIAPGCGWLSAALQLWPQWEAAVRRGGGVGLGLLGFDEGVHGMRCRTSGPTLQNETQTPAEGRTCHFRGGPDAARGAASTAEDVARARNVQPVPCATMGPLMMPRALFAALGGFNESLSQRGEPSSLLDCELSARVWAAGRAVVTTAWGARPFWPREQSVAWKARGFGRADHARCLFVSALFRALDAHITNAMRRVHAHAQLGTLTLPRHAPFYPPTPLYPCTPHPPLRCTHSSAAMASSSVSGAAKGRRAAQQLRSRPRQPRPRRWQWARRWRRVRLRV